MQKEQRGGSGDPQSAAVWLDTSGEWQVQGVVRHDEGNLRLTAAGVQILRSGRRGWRRTAWEEDLVVPADSLKSLRVLTRGRRGLILDLELRSDALATSGGTLTLRNCRPTTVLRALVDEVQAGNEALTVEWPNLPAGG